MKKLKDQLLINTTIPTLSIVCITYNHENYISVALDSFLNQITSFPVEILVHDDASLDNTQNIILDYKRKYPHILKPILQKNNQFSKTGFEFSLNELNRAKGKYIALCEGDDYWIDNYKLQKQVDFLESNLNFSFTFHKVLIKNELNSSVKEYSVPSKNVLNFYDLAKKHVIPTCSVVLRNSFLPRPFPDWYSKSKMGDIPLELLLADKGPVYFFPTAMGVYRKNINSLTESKIQKKQSRKAYIYIFRNLNSFFKYKYAHVFIFKIIKIYFGYIKDYLGLNPSLK